MRINPKFLVALVGAGLLALVSANTAIAVQQEAPFESIKMADEYVMPLRSDYDMTDRDSRTAFNKKKNEVTRFIKDKAAAVEDKLTGTGSMSDAEMTAFIEGFLIPSMAQTDEASLSNLGRVRKDMFRRMVMPARGGFRTAFIAKLTTEMKKIVEGNYHPVCRVNALIVLGELNRTEGNRSSKALPQPEPGILPYMLGILNNNTVDVKAKNFLMPAALAAIDRHAACRRPGTPNALSADEVTQIGDTMLGLIALDPEANNEIDTDVIAWNKRRAVRILGTVGVPGAGAKYAAKLREIFNDKNQSSAMRIDAISAYGQLAFANATQAEIKTVTLQIADLLAQFAEDEADYIDKKIEEIKFTVSFLDGEAAKSDGGGSKRATGPSAGVDADSGGGSSRDRAKEKNKIPEILPAYHRELVKRRIKTRVFAGKSALVGIKQGPIQQKGLKDLLAANAGAEEKAAIDAIVGVLDQIMKDTDVFEPEEDEEADDEDFVPRTKSYADELRDNLRKGAGDLRAEIEKLSPKPPAEEAAGGEETVDGQ